MINNLKLLFKALNVIGAVLLQSVLSDMLVLFPLADSMLE